jgi:hypothetical protein
MMGDIKSFPVLCILNLSLWDSVCGNVDIKYENTVIKPPCLVNGDDFLSYAPKIFHDKMIEKSGDFDFKLSLGKSYRSRDLAVINSRGFLKKTRCGGWRIDAMCSYHLPYCERPVLDVPLWQNFVSATEPQALTTRFFRKRIARRFLEMNGSKIRKQSCNGKLSIGLPIAFGGLGFYTDSEKKVDLTVSQKLLMKYNIRRIRLGMKPATLDYQMRYWSDKGRYALREKEVENHQKLSSSYYCDQYTRERARDDWLASLSREKISKRGIMICDSTRVRKARYGILKKEHKKLERKVGKEVRFNSHFLDTITMKQCGDRLNQTYVEPVKDFVVSTIDNSLKKKIIEHVNIHETYRTIDWSPMRSVKDLIGIFNN